MTAAEDSNGAGAATEDVRAAVAARVGVLKRLGFTEALQRLLEVQRAGSGRVGSAAAGPSAAAASPSRSTAHGSAGGGVGADVDAQDLIERLQTALQQLGMGDA